MLQEILYVYFSSTIFIAGWTSRYWQNTIMFAAECDSHITTGLSTMWWGHLHRYWRDIYCTEVLFVYRTLLHHDVIFLLILIINTFPILAYPPARLVEIAKTRFADVFKDRDSLAHLANSIHVYTEITCEDFMGR